MTMNSQEITLSTVTPIWTGGADGKCDRLHVTSIMGSLRWWYEVLVRSVGGNACDPNKHTCSYDLDKPPDGLCDVCRVFGATGWSRRFKIIITKEDLEPTGRRVFTLSRDHPAYYKNPKSQWYLSSNPRNGTVKLKIIATAPLDKEGKQIFDPEIIAALIQFVAHRGSIGAKPQMGLGVMRVVGQQSMQPLLNQLKLIDKLHQKNIDSKDCREYDELPSLHNMFFAKIRVDQAYATESETFNLKYDLRDMFRQSFSDKYLRHTIMGTTAKGEERQGAKIMMSYPDKDGMMRIWGWIPRPDPLRSEILVKIYGLLEGTYGDDFIGWLDFDPDKHNNVLRYLEEFLFKGVE